MASGIMATESNDRPAASMAGCDGVVCYAGVDWWYHNRGHSECQMMSRLAKRIPVLWVNSIGMRAPTPAKTELPWRRYFRKLRSTLKGLRRDDCGMWVYSPLFIPRYTPFVARLNGRLLSMQISLLCKGLGIRRPAAFVTMPTAAPAVERGKWVSVVFNRSDDFSAFPEADAAFVKPLEQKLLARSDSVIYVNRQLYEQEHAVVRDAQFIGHGVDYALFSSSRLAADPSRLPERIRHLPRPIVGFYGALDNYRFDLELLIKAARHIPYGTLLLIGPKAMDISRLEAEPNVVYLGPLPYTQLPRYAAHFDVALMPWLQNEFVTACNPIKLKEYLAVGFPIVAIRFPELSPYEELVYGADNHEQFLRGIDLALREDDRSLPARRRQKVAGDSWDALTDRVAAMLHVPVDSGRVRLAAPPLIPTALSADSDPSNPAARADSCANAAGP